ncbi:GGDEF domain-containing protein, partial [Kibdelosporangium lantanae]
MGHHQLGATDHRRGEAFQQNQLLGLGHPQVVLDRGSGSVEFDVVPAAEQQVQGLVEEFTAGTWQVLVVLPVERAEEGREQGAGDEGAEVGAGGEVLAEAGLALAQPVLLRRVGQTIRGTVRAGDRTYRYGGEEFMVLVPDTDLRGVLALGERVRLAVERLGIEHSGNAGGVVTVSVGPVEVDPAATITDAVDEASVA